MDGASDDDVVLVTLFDRPIAFHPLHRHVAHGQLALEGNSLLQDQESGES